MTEPSDLDLAELRRLAEEATPGPWLANWPDQCCGDYCIDNGSGRPLHNVDMSRADASHIAACDPPTVLALLDRVEAAEAEAQRMHSWQGLMGLLDEHWPADVFAAPDPYNGDSGADAGPRIVALIGLVDRLRATVERVRAVAAKLRQPLDLPPGVTQAVGGADAVAFAQGALEGTADQLDAALGDTAAGGEGA